MVIPKSRDRNIDRHRIYFLVLALFVGIVLFFLVSNLDYSITGMTVLDDSSLEYVSGKTEFLVSVNSFVEIDLDGFFRGDELTYLVTSNDDISSSVVGSLLILTPSTDFNGVSSVTIVASDNFNNTLRKDIVWGERY